tara:strand:+ start:33 stop:2210 length:2178 start_codon:yes stop_codon:yes gene_type:complete
MADKSIALELSIQLKDSNKSLEELNKLLKQAKEELKNVGNNKAEFEQLDSAIKKTEGSMNKASTSITTMNGKSKQLNTNLDSTGKAIGATAAGSVALGGSLGAVDKVTGGLAGKMIALKLAMSGVLKSFKTLKVAIIASGIGLLLIALVAIKTAFTSSEEGQNKFAKMMGVIGAITGNLVDLLADLGEKLISIFEDPKKAILDFAGLIKDNIINRFEGLAELIPQLGKAISLLFKGEFSEAGKVAADATAKVALGIEDFTDKVGGAIDKVKEFAAEQVREGNAAAKVADMRAKADKIDRALIVERSILESKIAELRLKAKQEDQFSAAERKAALLEAQSLEGNLLDQETKALNLRKNAQVLENTFSRTNKENLDKEANAIAAVNNQVAKRATIARTLQRELNTINGQIEAADAAILAEKIAAEAELSEAIEGIRKANIDTEDEKRKEEKDKIDKQYDELLEKAKKYNLDTTGLDDARIAKKQELDDKYKKDKDAKDLAEQEKLIGKLKFDQKTAEDDFQARREEINRREQILIEDKTLTDKQRSILEEQFKDERLRIAEAEESSRRELSSQRLQMAGDILGAINGLAQAFAKDDEAGQRKAFKLNKAAGIGQAIISTAVGINNAFINPADVASGIAFIKSGLIASSGIAQIATIKKTEFKGASSITTPATSPTLGSGGAGTTPIGFTQNLNTTQVPTTKVIVTETDIRRATRNIDGIYNKAVVVE